MRLLIDGQTLSTPDIHRGIGEVFLQILFLIANKKKDIKIFLAVYDDFDVNSIIPIRESLNIINLGKALIINDESSRTYDHSIINAIENNFIDIFWIPNPLMPNVHFIHSKPPCKVIITMYDLIPLVLHDFYLKKYPKDISNEYKFRLSRIDAISDQITSISNSTKRDLIKLLNIEPNKIHTIYLGSKVPLLGLKKKLNRDLKTILYLGGFDYRKNMYNGLVAFQKLLFRYNHSDLKFVVVCSYDETSRLIFMEWVDTLGISGRVELTGYVSDSRLQELYLSADVFFFPSLYEGFGLPLLEAMAAGTPVAGSDSSSIPEVIGDAGLLFNPEDPQDMAEKLYQLLTDTNGAKKIIEKAQKRAGEFTWEKTAKQYLDLFAQVSFASPIITIKPYKIAYFSPVSPQKSGISIYSEELLSSLARYIPNIDLFVDEGITPSNSFIQEFIPWFSYNEFPKYLSEKKYDTIIYNMGNNVMHEYIYKTLLKYPGIVILHDYVLHPFIQHITLHVGKSDEYLDEMKYAYGNEGQRYARQSIAGSYLPIDFFKFPLNEKVIESGTKVIVHSKFVRDLLSNYSNVDIIPHGRDSVKKVDYAILNNKRELNLNKKYPIISIFGYINSNKRINVTLNVFKKINVAYPNAILLICGEIEKNHKKTITEYLIQNNLLKNVVITGYLNSLQYSKYLSCTDIVINLRSPTMGETSGTLLDALAYGKPTIVSNIGTYKEVPDYCCWKVDIDSYESELLFAYIMEMARNKQLREKMGVNAKKYIEKNHRWDKVAQQYVYAIEKLIENK